MSLFLIISESERDSQRGAVAAVRNLGRQALAPCLKGKENEQHFNPPSPNHGRPRARSRVLPMGVLRFQLEQEGSTKCALDFDLKVRI